MGQIAYIGVGTNLGDRQENFRRAIAEVRGIADTKVVSQSSLYESEPHGRARNWFVNGVIGVETTLEAKDLLKALQKIEKTMGRKRETEKKSVSRVIDLDILFFGDQVINSRTLKIPHPELVNRKFVLLPLSELAPAFHHPVLGTSVSSLTVSTQDPTKVMLFRG